MTPTPSLDADLRAILDERRASMALFTDEHRPLNLYALYREDLEMPAGKLAAQCGHAFQLALEAARARDAGIEARYKGSGNGTKVVMKARNLGQLIRAYRDAQAAGLPCALVIDRGHLLPPHFDGQPLFTALGIGPCYRDEAAGFLKRYTLAR